MIRIVFRMMMIAVMMMIIESLRHGMVVGMSTVTMMIIITRMMISISTINFSSSERIVRNKRV